MKKLFLIAMSGLFLILFSSCGYEIKKDADTTVSETTTSSSTTVKATDEITTITTTTETTTENTTTKQDVSNSVLEDYHSKNFKNSDMLIKDFDGDGVEDMIIFERETNSGNLTDECSFHYIKEKNGTVYEADELEIEDIFAEEESICDGATEYIEAVVNKDGYINFNYLYRHDEWSADYLIISIKNDKLNIEKHLIDPGYTIGVALFNKKDYPDNWDTKKLYERDEESKIKGKYSTYKEALEKEIGTYGFSWKKIKDIVTFEKYINEPDKDITLLFSKKSVNN